MLTVISHQSELDEHCRGMFAVGIIALDTEFVRTRTLKPLLGLIQIFYAEHVVLIDPLNGLDLNPLKAVIASDKVVKIVHACSEDIEALITGLEIVPSTLFDTQFALALLNKGAGWGYGRFVNEYLGVSLEKAEARTDWLARPLTQEQLSYAADDVIYLDRAYNILKLELEDTFMFPLVLQESASLIERKQAQMPLRFAFLQIKNAWRLQAKQRTVLQYLAAWRLREARVQDMALNFVVKESLLITLAQRMPTTMSALHAIPELLAPTKRRYGHVLLTLISRAIQHHERLPESAHIPKLKRVSEFATYKQTFASLQTLCIQIAETAKIPPEVFASKKQINQLLSWWWLLCDENRAMGLKPELLRSWRYALCGPSITTLLAGDPPEQNELLAQIEDIEHDLCDL